jgi:hypothetical protein
LIASVGSPILLSISVFAITGCASPREIESQRCAATGAAIPCEDPFEFCTIVHRAGARGDDEGRVLRKLIRCPARTRRSITREDGGMTPALILPHL